MGAQSPRYRQVLLLHTLHGLKYREIAQRLGISNSCVAMRMKRAREKILRHLIDHLGDPVEDTEGEPS